MDWLRMAAYTCKAPRAPASQRKRTRTLCMFVKISKRFWYCIGMKLCKRRRSEFMICRMMITLRPTGRLILERSAFPSLKVDPFYNRQLPHHRQAVRRGLLETGGITRPQEIKTMMYSQNNNRQL